MSISNFDADAAKERMKKMYHVGYKNKKELNMEVDACEPDGYLYHGWEECISSGTAYLYITPFKNYAEQITNHLKDVHDNLGFKRVYFDKVNAYEPFITTYSEDNSGNPVYKWEDVDAIYDKILSMGVKPFVMISAIPKALASDPANTNFDGGNSSAPRDYTKWKQYCKSFVNHLIDRYGSEEAASWYFQIMNEPDIANVYWSGTFEEFLKTYDYAAEGIKEVDRRIKVGPGGFAFTDGHLIAAFLDHVTSKNYDLDGCPNGAPMDFINSHAYRLLRAGSLEDDLDRLKRYMNSYFGPHNDKELIISEWNTDSRIIPSPIHDGAINAAFIIRQVNEASREFFSDPSKTCFFSFWCHSDVFDEQGEPDGEFSGLYGLITINGIRKPNYNAFKMLHMLGKSRIAVSGGNNDVNGIATFNNEAITIILYNCLYDIARAEGDSKFDRIINLKVDNIPWSKVKLEHYRIDNLRSNSYTAWKEMGSPQYCSEGQLQYLRENMDLELLEESRIISTLTGRLTEWFELPMPSVSMLVITPVDREFKKPDADQYKILGSL